jgi:uncharacterized protein YbbC (DUF1343 family)
MPVATGLERFLEHPPEAVAEGRLGLLCNPASVDPQFRHARQLIHARLPGRLTALYSPQHGFMAEKQDNMIESDHGSDPLLGLPVFSLYSQTRIPTAEMLAPVDVLLVDLQDVGTRVYTFIYTLSYCMEAARRYGKQVVVLDRPNPVGGRHVEGNCLTPECASFVGRYPIPMRHGLTVGELARLFNDHFGIGCELTVVTMQGWRRGMGFADTGLPWVAPSPNLPTPASALVYPGQVIWEGTNVSEGRGTTLPFELFGAPYLATDRILDAVGGDCQPGCILRPAMFEPTSGKWQGTTCQGFQIHVTDPDRLRPYRLSLNLLSAVCRGHPESFAWREGPYEYAYRRRPIDLIIGDRRLRRRLEAGEPVDRLAAEWAEDLAAFETVRERYLLYPDDESG